VIYSEKGIKSYLEQLTKDELYKLFVEFIEKDDNARISLNYLIKEKLRFSKLLSEDISSFDLHSSISYLEKEVPKLLIECESLFEEIDYQDYHYHHYDYDEYSNWDFSKGITRLKNFTDTLLQLVYKGNYIFGTVGLITTLLKVEQWASQYEDDNDDNELNNMIYDLEEQIEEAFDYIKQLHNTNADAQNFVVDLMDWLLSRCKEIEDLWEYMTVLNFLVFDSSYLYKLKERILKLDQDFLHSNKISDESVRYSLIKWWVNLSLSFDLEKEAYYAVNKLDNLSSSLALLFVSYYERHQNWKKAIELLQNVITQENYPQRSNYERMLKLSEKTNSHSLIQRWYEKMLLTFPDVNTFKKCLSFLNSEEEKAEKIEEWIERISSKKNHDIIIQIYLYFNEVDKAWNEYIENKPYFYMISSTIQQLFEAMKKHDPNRLIPIYHDIVNENINLKKRTHYQTAAQWMKELKNLYQLTNRTEQWVNYYHNLLIEYKGYRALQEEFRKAKLE